MPDPQSTGSSFGRKMNRLVHCLALVLCHAVVPATVAPPRRARDFEVDDADALRERMLAAGYQESTPANNHPARKRVYFRIPTAMIGSSLSISPTIWRSVTTILRSFVHAPVRG